MNLVASREKLRSSFENGEKPFSPPLDKYREFRNTENWRTSLGVETLCEYILYLEEKCEKLEKEKTAK